VQEKADSSRLLSACREELPTAGSGRMRLRLRERAPTGVRSTCAALSLSTTSSRFPGQVGPPREALQKWGGGGF